MKTQMASVDAPMATTDCYQSISPGHVWTYIRNLEIGIQPYRLMEMPDCLITIEATRLLGPIIERSNARQQHAQAVA